CLSLDRHLFFSLFPYTTLFRSLYLLHVLPWKACPFPISCCIRYPFVFGISNKCRAIREFHLVAWSVIHHIKCRHHAGRISLFIKDRKSTRLNSSHEWISYAVFC